MATFKIAQNKVDADMVDVYTPRQGRQTNILWASMHIDFFHELLDTEAFQYMDTRLNNGAEVEFSLKVEPL